MPISQVGSTTTGNVTNANLTVTLPSGMQQGDVIILWIAHRSTIGYQVPSGWTKLLNVGSGNTTNASTASISSGELFYIVRGASNPTASFTKESGTGSLTYYRCMAFRGVDATNPIRSSVIQTLGTANATVVTTTGNTIDGSSGDLAMIFGSGARGTGSAYFSNWQINSTPTTSITEATDQSVSSTPGIAIGVAWSTLTSNLSASTIQFTAGSSARHTVAGVVLASNDIRGELGSSSANKAIRISSSLSGGPAARATYSGLLDITLKMTAESRTTTTTSEIWHSPYIVWASPSDVWSGYRLQLMAPNPRLSQGGGIQIYKSGGLLTDSWGTFFDFGDTIYVQIIQTASNLTVRTGPSLDSLTTRISVSDTPLANSNVRFYLMGAQCTVKFDDIAGTIVDTFDSYSTGSIANNATVGQWTSVIGSGDDISIIDDGSSGVPAVTENATLSASGSVSYAITGVLGTEGSPANNQVQFNGTISGHFVRIHSNNTYSNSGQTIEHGASIYAISNGGLEYNRTRMWFGLQNTDFTQGYCVNVMHTGTVLQIFSGSSTDLAWGLNSSGQSSIPLGQWYTVRITHNLSNGAINVWVNDVLIITYTDTTYRSGRVGLSNLSTNGYFDDIIGFAPQDWNSISTGYYANTTLDNWVVTGFPSGNYFQVQEVSPAVPHAPAILGNATASALGNFGNPKRRVMISL